jgi:signal transduction histidine kinase
MSARYIIKNSIDIIYLVSDKSTKIISGNELYKEYTSHIRPENFIDLMAEETDIEDFNESILRAKRIGPLPVRLYAKTKQKTGSSRWVLWNIYYIIESFHFIGIPLVDVTSRTSYEFEKQKKLLEDFRFILSHELRQPLTSLSGLIVMLSDCDNKENQEIIAMINDSVLKLDESIAILMAKTTRES